MENSMLLGFLNNLKKKKNNEFSKKNSKVKNIQKVSFPKNKMQDLVNPSYDKNQTYVTKEFFILFRKIFEFLKRAIGLQIQSNKKTSPAISFGTGNRS